MKTKTRDRSKAARAKRAKPTRLKLKLNQICTDGGTQVRQYSNQEIALEYADLMLDGVEFPPVDVFQDKTGAYLMSDGFLRLQAAGFAHKKELVCNVFQGTNRDALLHAIEANRQHGLPLTSSDKRKAIGTLLTQHAQWSDRRIAAFVGVSHRTVAAVRIDMKPRGELDKLSNSRLTINGRHYPAERRSPQTGIRVHGGSDPGSEPASRLAGQAWTMDVPQPPPPSWVEISSCKIPCPRCNGSGYIEVAATASTDTKRRTRSSKASGRQRTSAAGREGGLATRRAMAVARLKKKRVFSGICG